MSLVNESHPKFGSIYCRSTNRNRTLLEGKLLEYYSCDPAIYDAAVFSSGMNAISCLFEIMANKRNKRIFIIGDELYSDTFKIAKYITTSAVNSTVETVDVRDFNGITSLFKKHGNNVKLLFLESCTNPSGQMIDYSRLAELRKYAKELVICVDNTWTSGLFNPFDYGVDIVIESMTKYIGGGKCIGGIMLGKHTFMKKIAEWIRIYGQFISSDCCKIFLQELETIKERVKVTSTLGLTIAQYLEKHENVSRVMYPILKSHPTFNLNKQFLTNGPGVVWFHINTELNNLTKVRTILSENKYLRYETSYGSPYSKIDPWPIIGISGLYEEPQQIAFDKSIGVWIRIAIGYESNEELIINGLNEILSEILNGFTI